MQLNFVKLHFFIGGKVEKTNLCKLFGEYVCSDEMLKKHMPKKHYKVYKGIKENGEPLDINTAKAVAKAIKDWAIEKGATHYTHWFMPLTGKTAEKQISFVEITKDGKMIADFNEKELIKGETDASSFPNGGERMTFEARGYTVWDYTSPVFIKEDNSKNKVVYIPTAFCSYNGTALDEKTPLLRALESLNREALRVLKILGYKNVKKVNFHSGIEQEYFLVKTQDYKKRTDLKFLGRTLLGSEPLKSQEICSHYYGIIEDRISAFMNQVDITLWKMGITAKHQHNEVAPSQYELVPIYSLTNIACDQNQLIMEVIDSTAKKHGLTALFEEKPFSYINGSGKHVNWSISTDTGINLFDSKIKDKSLFFTFFVSVIAAIDKYNKLIRLSASYRGNDLRLGGGEAPPSIVSVFASDYILGKYKEFIENKDNDTKGSFLETGVKSLPKMLRDFCDRNRTSPFAYSDNKFEFRTVGSSQSVAFPSTCMCVALSKILKDMADEVEKFSGDKREKLLALVSENFNKHKKVIFNGNSYDEGWKEEAKSRGIKEYKDSLSVYETLDDLDILQAFEDTKVLNANELSLRKATLINNYVGTVMLEANILENMFNKEIFTSLDCLISVLSTRENCNDIVKKAKLLFPLVSSLTNLIAKINNENNMPKKCELISKQLLIIMKEIRTTYDSIEKYIPKTNQPFPTYNDVLF
jgi:glutamine synthetase